MRKAIQTQRRFDCHSINNVTLNLNCRDEIVPILFALQHVYSQTTVLDSILRLVESDVNASSRNDRGREGMDYWQIVVLAAARLGCDLDYDKLQDLADQHRALRQIMGIGDWEAATDFNWRRIRDNICLLKPTTIEQISHLIVAEGYVLKPEAPKKVRADSFVVETNIHYPTESSLIVDGVRKVLELCVALAEVYVLEGWRQHEHLLKKIKRIARQINRISSRKGTDYKKRLITHYRTLLKDAESILARAEKSCETLCKDFDLALSAHAKIADMKTFIDRTRHVCGTATRRVLQGETVPNEEKLFSIFEPHTQLYRRGKAGQPTQFGRLIQVYEDGAGYICHHHLVDRNQVDSAVVVAQTRIVQTRLLNRIEEISFDRGFHSPENQVQLSQIVPHVCLPKTGAKQSLEQTKSASVIFNRSKKRHSGVESTIGAMQSGNGLVRCRDASELGFERYVALAILGRNLHVLGKHLIASQEENALAAFSRRAAA